MSKICSPVSTDLSLPYLIDEKQTVYFKAQNYVFINVYSTSSDAVPLSPYRDSDRRFSTSGFFHESISPKPLSIPLGPFQIF